MGKKKGHKKHAEREEDSKPGPSGDRGSHHKQPKHPPYQAPGPSGDGGSQQASAWGPQRSQREPPPQQAGPSSQPPQQGGWAGVKRVQGSPQHQQGPELKGAWAKKKFQQGSPTHQKDAGPPQYQQPVSPQYQQPVPSQYQQPQQQYLQSQVQYQQPQQYQQPVQQYPTQQQTAWGYQQALPQQQQQPGPSTQMQYQEYQQPAPQSVWGRIPPEMAEQQPGPSTQQQKPYHQPMEVTPTPSDTAFEFASRIYAPHKSGAQIVVAANFFRLSINNPNLVVYHYNVEMNPDKPKFLLREVWKKFAAKMFPNRLTAFVEKNAFSNGPLFNGKTCEATVTVFNYESNREKEYTVSIEEVRKVNFAHFMNYAEKAVKGRAMKTLPEAELSVIEILLKEWAADNCIVSGRCAFFPSEYDRSSVELSDKLLMRAGFFQSVTLGSVPYLNFDISHKAFYRSAPILDIYNCFYNNYTRTVDEEEFNHFVRTVKVEYQLPNNPDSRRVFRVNKLVGNAKNQTFKKDDGSKLTVAEYFHREKKLSLRYPEKPLLWVGPTQKSIFVPMEFCRILPDQVFKGMTNNREKTQMVKSATCNAAVYFRKVLDIFRKVSINNHPLMKDFGIVVSHQMEKVPARVLDPPELRTSRQSIMVKEGVWKIRDFLEPVTLKKWCILNADKQMRRDNILTLQNLIKNKGNQLNMRVSDPIKDTIHVSGSFAELKKVFSQLRDMDLVFVIITEAKGLYSRVKTICETQEGVLTQCVKSRTVTQDQMKLSTTVENILLKVNAKLGGKNLTLNHNSVPECLKGYVMVVGADVTHPSPGMKIPSVAAVAVSCDPAAFQYGMTTRVQPKGEMIVDLKEIMGIHLKKFYALRNRYPEKIIFFRDGVSEGELPKVFRMELMALKSACEKYCQPKITFIVVQKRHHTKLFPTRKEDEQGRNLNVPVGTCVDSQIVHPRDLDFYLVSHASILGTARPTRYRLLHDDSKITDDELEKLTFYLCHLFSRCNRSVSYPSPTYNAHLAAFRARAYLEGLNISGEQDIGSIQKKLTDNISNVSPMFFV